MADFLEIKQNPTRGELIVIHLKTSPHAKNLTGSAKLSLKYLPDRDIVDAQNFNMWVEKKSEASPPSWENLAADLTNIFYDKLLPKHLEITLTIDYANKTTHKIDLLRQQPKYKLPEALKDFFHYQ